MVDWCAVKITRSHLDFVTFFKENGYVQDQIDDGKIYAFKYGLCDNIKGAHFLQ